MRSKVIKNTGHLIKAWVVWQVNTAFYVWAKQQYIWAKKKYTFGRRKNIRLGEKKIIHLGERKIVPGNISYWYL